MSVAVAFLGHLVPATASHDQQDWAPVMIMGAELWEDDDHPFTWIALRRDGKPELFYFDQVRFTWAMEEDES